MTRVALALGSIALLAALALPAVAGETFKSKVSIDFFPGERRVDFFGGEVSSPKGKCVGERKVTLYKKEHRNSDPVKVGSDETVPGTGQWGVEVSPEARFYFARVKEAKIGGGRCEKDDSKELEFKP